MRLNKVHIFEKSDRDIRSYSTPLTIKRLFKQTKQKTVEWRVEYLGSNGAMMSERRKGGGKCQNSLPPPCRSLVQVFGAVDEVEWWQVDTKGRQCSRKE